MSKKHDKPLPKNVNWSYRVVQHEFPIGPDYFRIHEVYYDENGEIMSASKDCVKFGGLDVDELIVDMETAINDAKKYPTLYATDLFYE